jgi:hypothetical protein
MCLGMVRFIRTLQQPENIGLGGEKYQTIRKERMTIGEDMVRRTDTSWEHCAVGKLKKMCVLGCVGMKTLRKNCVFFLFLLDRGA